jgi:hypothetical protein
MAKVTGPLFSLSASGKLGDAIVFTKWRGIIDVRSWVKPKNNQQPNQMIVRNNFSASVDFYHELSGADMEALRKVAENKPYTGYNQYIAWCRDCFEAGDTWVRIKDVSIDTITTTGCHIHGTPSQSGKLKAFWGTTPGSWTDSLEEASSGSADVDHELTISGLIPSTTYWIQYNYPLASSKYGYSGYYTFTTAAT